LPGAFLSRTKAGGELSSPVSSFFHFDGGFLVRGRIKKIVRDRSFGFISAENGKEIFFHSSSLEGLDFSDLEEGNIVEFKKVSGRKGPQAENVTRVEQKKGWWTE